MKKSFFLTLLVTSFVMSSALLARVETKLVTCKSADYQMSRNPECEAVNGTILNIEIIHRISNTWCSDYNSGFTSNQVWTNSGCSATFKVTYETDRHGPHRPGPGPHRPPRPQPLVTCYFELYDGGDNYVNTVDGFGPYQQMACARASEKCEIEKDRRNMRGGQCFQQGFAPRQVSCSVYKYESRGREDFLGSVSATAFDMNKACRKAKNECERGNDYYRYTCEDQMRRHRPTPTPPPPRRRVYRR